MANFTQIAYEMQNRIEKDAKNYVFLTEIRDELRWDASNLRKFIARHGLKTKKVRNPKYGNRYCIALEISEMKKLLEYKFG